jgi:hypothetical protein
VIVSVPSGKAVDATLAVPPFRETLPRLVFPLLKVTEPVAVPPYCPVIVAVKFTDCPTAEGFTDETNAVEELALLTITLAVPVSVL